MPSDAMMRALMALAKPMPSHPRGGIYEQGNVDLYAQPSVPNPDGGRSTVYSFSVNFDGKEYLLPRVTPDGRLLSEDDAVNEFRRTGKHLGVFDSPLSATLYAKRLHDDYERGKYRVRPMPSHRVVPPQVGRGRRG